MILSWRSTGHAGLEWADRRVSVGGRRGRSSTIARSNATFYPGDVLSEKKEAPDSAQPDFWSQRYVSGQTPWQLDHVPAQLRAFTRTLPARSKILIPGCGEDHGTIAAFAQAGHRITAIDFSPPAIEHMKKALPQFSDRIILGDFFSYDFGLAAFELVYERTFLCSLPPRLWNDYAARVTQLLQAQGILAGFFFYGEESDPPPYPLTESTASGIFGSHFELRRSERVTDSLPIFAGTEKWQEWQLRS